MAKDIPTSLVLSPHYLFIYLPFEVFFLVFCIYASLLMPTICGFSDTATQPVCVLRAVYIFVCQDLFLLLCSKLNVRKTGWLEVSERLDLFVRVSERLRGCLGFGLF